MALNWQRYVIRRRIIDIHLKRIGIIGLLFLGKNADRILKLPVREIKLSECVETGRRLQRVRFDDCPNGSKVMAPHRSSQPWIPNSVHFWMSDSIQ